MSDEIKIKNNQGLFTLKIVSKLVECRIVKGGTASYEAIPISKIVYIGLVYKQHFFLLVIAALSTFVSIGLGVAARNDDDYALVGMMLFFGVVSLITFFLTRQSVRRPSGMVQNQSVDYFMGLVT